MSKTTYLRRKQQGLCVKCGGEIEEERKGKVICLKCTHKDSVEKQKDREFRRSIGLCPRCGKNKLVGNDKNCLDCRAKNYTYRTQYYENHPEILAESLDRWNKNRVIKYHIMKDAGYCVECGEEVTDGNYSRCTKCRAKCRSKYVSRATPFEEHQQQIWKSQGLCHLCGQPLYKKFGLCEHHYLIQVEANKKGINKKWREDNEKFFRKKTS